MTKLTATIKAKCTLEQYNAALEAAAVQGKNLSEYVRDVLFGKNELNDLSQQITLLRSQLLTENGQKESDGADTALLIEMLLLLRAIAGGERNMMVKSEIERIGLQPWSAPIERP